MCNILSAAVSPSPSPSKSSALDTLLLGAKDSSRKKVTARKNRRSRKNVNAKGDARPMSSQSVPQDDVDDARPHVKEHEPLPCIPPTVLRKILYIDNLFRKYIALDKPRCSESYLRRMSCSSLTVQGPCNILIMSASTKTNF